MNHNVIAFIVQISENGELGIGEEAGEKNKREERNDRREWNKMNEKTKKETINVFCS